MTAAVAASMLTGGVVGATLFGTAASTAATTSTPAASSAPSGGPGGGPPNGGVFKPNENKAHEAGESAQREAQETAGQVPTVP